MKNFYNVLMAGGTLKLYATEPTPEDREQIEKEDL
jgi:hypothetical protein